VQLEPSVPLLYIDTYIDRPRGRDPLLRADRRVVHNSAIRQVLSETEEFVPSRVLLTLFQRDRIFGRDRSADYASALADNRDSIPQFGGVFSQALDSAAALSGR
jgi:hypothetical protein